MDVIPQVPQVKPSNTDDSRKRKVNMNNPNLSLALNSITFKITKDMNCGTTAFIFKDSKNDKLFLRLHLI